MQSINAQRAPVVEAEARVVPLRHGSRVDVLAEGDLEQVRGAVLRVLDEVGVSVASADALEALRSAGAQVDTATHRVKLPAVLVQDVLAKAGGDLVLAARDPACDLRVDGTVGWMTTAGRADMVVDPETDERREGRETDVAVVARLVDALPQLGFTGPSVAAQDVAVGSRLLRELGAQLTNTSKHVQAQVPEDASSADAFIEIARAVAGGEASLRERPVVSALFPISTPFRLDGLEAAAVVARAGIPLGSVATPHAGGNAPATAAGALVAAAASAIGGIVCLQLLVPDASTFVGTTALLAGPRDAPTQAGSQGLWFQLAWVQLAGRLGLHAYAGAFATGSHSSDWQAGMESGLSGTAGWMTPPDLLAAAGLRGGGRVFSPIGMLLDAELFDLVRRIPLGFDVDDEALAVNVIDEVGPAEHFLGEQHTLRHFRETWTSRFMDTNTWEAWEAEGRPEPPEHASGYLRELLASHQPAPLPAAAEERIREVIADHERDHG